MTDALRGYWVVYGMKDKATIKGGPFPRYDIAVQEAERIGKRFTYVGFSVRFGTEAEVKRV
jgi:hypothetical protein